MSLFCCMTLGQAVAGFAVGACALRLAVVELGVQTAVYWAAAMMDTCPFGYFDGGIEKTGRRQRER